MIIQLLFVVLILSLAYCVLLKWPRYEEPIQYEPPAARLPATRRPNGSLQFEEEDASLPFATYIGHVNSQTSPLNPQMCCSSTIPEITDLDANLSILH
jgi:hypothetical protein